MCGRQDLQCLAVLGSLSMFSQHISVGKHCADSKEPLFGQPAACTHKNLYEKHSQTPKTVKLSHQNPRCFSVKQRAKTGSCCFKATQACLNQIGVFMLVFTTSFENAAFHNHSHPSHFYATSSEQVYINATSLSQKSLSLMTFALLLLKCG